MVKLFVHSPSHTKPRSHILCIAVTVYRSHSQKKEKKYAFRHSNKSPPPPLRTGPLGDSPKMRLPLNVCRPAI